MFTKNVLFHTNSCRNVLTGPAVRGYGLDLMLLLFLG